VFALIAFGLAAHWACLIVAAVLAACGAGAFGFARSAAPREIAPSRSISDWLVDTAKRNPEALLVLGAGLALLMRSRSKSAPWTSLCRNWTARDFVANAFAHCRCVELSSPKEVASFISVLGQLRVLGARAKHVA
jgi:hypothetical protein